MTFYLASMMDMLQRGLDNSQSTAESWDTVWDNTFNGASFGGDTLFGSMVQLGLLFALGGIIVSAIIIYQDISNNRPVRWSFLIWPLIATILFSGDGTVLAGAILGLRNLFNQISDQIAASAIFGVKMDEALKDLGGSYQFRALIENAYRECATKSGEARVICLESAAQTAEAYADTFGNLYGPMGWIGDIVDTFREAGENLVSGNGISYFGLMSPIWQPIVFAIMFLFMEAYQNILEAVMVLVSLTAPLAVGGSIIGFGKPALTGWLSGFVALGLAKIFFNTLLGLSASVVTTAGINEPNWFPFFVGLAAPVISFAMGSGSGFVMWSSITGTLSTAASGGASVLGKVAKSS